MFIKLTRVKGHSYAQLVESFRDDSGQPRQRNLINLGRVDENDGQVDKLLQSLLKARGLAPRETSTPQVRFESALALGDVWALDQLWRELGFDCLGAVFRQMGDLSRAHAQFHDVLVQDPDHAEAGRALAEISPDAASAYYDEGHACLVAGDMPVTVVDLLEMIDVEHQDRHPDAAGRISLGQGADLAEKISAVVKTGERIANRPLKHVALKPPVVRIEAHQFEHHLGAQLNAVAILERDRPVRGDRRFVHERAVRAAQIGDLSDPFGTDGNPGVPS